jgi:hypothetical protein
MLTFPELRKLPKEFLIDLWKTAQTVAYDDLMALNKVRKQIDGLFPIRLADVPAEPIWVSFTRMFSGGPLKLPQTRDELVKEETRLIEKLDSDNEWMLRIDRAIGDRRPALVRILFDEDFPEAWSAVEPRLAVRTLDLDD